MAKSTTPETAPIYDLHDRWLRQVLPAGDSLFTPAQPIWTNEHLAELERDFVGQPDLTSGKSYLDKLRDQLGPSSDGARQLMAELHAIHFLAITTGSISAATKVNTLEAIVSWMAVPVEIPDDVKLAMSPGLLHPGQWALTRRDTQITWLLELSRKWRALGDQAPTDPWETREVARSVTAASADAARRSFLHLAYPDTFESSVSTAHREMMIRRFADDPEASDDLDRQLLEIRAALTPEYGERFSFYDDPLELMWFKPKAWWTYQEWLAKFRALPAFDEVERDYKLELAGRLSSVASIIEDDGGDWAGALRAVINDKHNNLTGWRANGTFLKWIDAEPAAAREALRALWAAADDPLDRFDAFARSVTPVLEQPGQRLIMTSFLLMAQDASRLPPVKVRAFRRSWRLSGFGVDPDDASVADIYRRALLFLDELVRDSQGWQVPLRDRLDAQGAVWSLINRDDESSGLPDGWSQEEWNEFSNWRETKPEPHDDDDEIEGGQAPGDGDTEPDEPAVDHIAKAAKDLSVEREVLDEIVQLLDDKQQVVLYGPPGTGKTFLAVALARAIAQGDEARVAVVQFHPATTYEDFFESLRPTLTEQGDVIYQRTDGPLVDIADRARHDRDRTYVMVIDEINRANLPKVFGELLFLLEYRKESARTLYRPTERFNLPENLWFIGTMNTADRSVALIDAAMRRRFHFVPFFPHEGPMKPLLRTWLTSRKQPTRIADFLDAVNAELLDQLGDHLLIGPSHFMKSDLSDAALERIWTYNVFPLLEEQLWGQRDEIARWRWTTVRQRFAEILTGRRQPDEPPQNIEGDETSEPAGYDDDLG